MYLCKYILAKFTVFCFLFFSWYTPTNGKHTDDHDMENLCTLTFFRMIHIPIISNLDGYELQELYFYTHILCKNVAKNKV